MGAGQQQVRFVWASVGAFHGCLWTFTMTEVWAWCRAAEALVDCSTSPWDDPGCRPSHADKRCAWRRRLLREEIYAVTPRRDRGGNRGSCRTAAQPDGMTLENIAESTVSAIAQENHLVANGQETTLSRRPARP